MKSNKVNKWIFLGATSMLFILVIYKAISLSMTHDESASFFYLNDKNILGYLFNSGVWPNANNHYLNTLGFQIFSSLFGPKEWAIRLFNVLIFLVYSFYSYKLSELFKKRSTRLLLLVFLLFNPYVLDFFSLARGYGLSLGFSLGAIYHLWSFLKMEKLAHLYLGAFYLLIATLSLFSSLILYPALFGPIVIYLFIKHFKQWSNKEFYVPLIIMFLATIITLILTTIPLKALSQNAEFKWGAPSLIECFQSLISNSLYSNKYIPYIALITGILISFLTYALYKFSYTLKTKNTFLKSQNFYFTFTSFLLLILAMVASRYILGTYYPVDRKTIILIPFLVLLICSVFELNKSKLVNTIQFLIAITLILNFVFSFQYDQVREWWYDRDTKEFFTNIVEDANGKNFTVGCNWHFHPTLLFYSKKKFPEKSIIMPYNKKIVVEDKYDYFMCFDSDYDKLKNDYMVLSKNSAGRMLLKLKEK